MGTDMKDESEKYFNSALRDFTFDVACGAAIRHLYELGYTPEQIAERLDYPISVDRVKKYVSKLKIKGAEELEGEAYEMVRDYDEYGRSCFVRVKKR